MVTGNRIPLRYIKVLSSFLIFIMLCISLPPVAPHSVQAANATSQSAHTATAAGEDTRLALAPGIQPSDHIRTNPAAPLADTQPATLDQPLALARIPSATTASGLSNGQMLLTFRIRNTLPAINSPAIPDGATVADKVALAAAFNYADDPNTIHNVLLTDDLTTSATFVTADPPPTRQGDGLAWSLGDLPPGTTTTVTLTLNATPDGSDFTVLDSGAVAWGTLHGRAVSATAVPAGLASNDLSSWLVRTIDADTHDEYMLDALAKVGGDPQALFAFVREMRYESYLGSLRGTRGTLWGQAGNALDQSSLLIAMLRASGIPARYRHGTLTETRAQEMLASMFSPPSGVIGQVPADAVIGDPLHDEELLRESRDHWWVEAYLPGQGWQNLDPSFPNATVGDSFVESENIASDGTDRIAVVPQETRHTVTMRLRVERYTQFPAAAPNGMPTSYPLDVTFNTVEVIGEPVSLAHLVEEDVQAGFFYVKTTDYKPFLLVDGQEIIGANYQESVSNFPFGTEMVTGIWLQFAVQDGEGNVEIYEREIADRVGYEFRQTPGTVPFSAAGGDKPLISSLSTYTTLFAPSVVSPDAINALYPNLTDALQRGQAAYDTVQALIAAGQEKDTEQLPVLRAAVQDVNQAALVSQQMHLLTFAATSDFGMQRTGDTYLIRPYYDSPRILISSWEHDTVNERHTIRMDLRKNDLRTVVSPGQSVHGLVAFNYARGMQESVLESLLLEQMSGQDVQSVSQVFLHAQDQGIPFRALASSSLAELDDLTISEEAKARIMRILTDRPSRYLIIVPERPVQIGDTATVGWYQLDMVTGETLDMMEDGQRQGLVEVSLRFTSSNEEVAAALIGFLQGFALQGMAFLAYLMERLPVSYHGCPPDASAPCENSLKAVWQESIERATDHTNAVISPMVGYAKVAKDCGTYLDLIPSWLAKTGDYVEAYGKGIGIKVDLKDPVNKKTGKLESRGAIFFKCVNDIGGLNDASIPTSFRYAGGFLQGASLFNVFAQSLVDPPLPTLLMDMANNAPAQNRAEVDLTVSASAPDASLSGDLTVPNSMLTSIPGSASGYAPALSGMGVGGDGSAYGVASYAASVNTEITSGRVILGPSSGSLNVGGQSVSLPNGGAIAGYSGTVDVAESGANQDQVTLDSSGAATFFTLNLSSDSSTIDPQTPATFDAQIVTNHSGTYRVYVEAPAGWIVRIDDSGGVSANPPAGTAPDDYRLAVVAHDLRAPDLLVSAVHTVTVVPFDGVDMTVSPDPMISVPWGPITDNNQESTNNGQAQLPDSAFTIAISNTSNVARSFEVIIGGSLPADWLVVDGQAGQSTTITLPPGGTGHVGLYVIPAVDTLPPAGTPYSFSVSATATDNPALNTSTTQTYTTPALAYAHLSATPDMIYTIPGGSGEATVALTNVGNTADSFPLTVATADPNLTLSGVSGPVTVAAGASNEQTLTVQTAGGNVGDRTVVNIGTQSAAYDQNISVGVQLVSEQAICPFTAARGVDGPAGAALSAALRDLGTRIDTLDRDIDDTEQRAQVVSAIEAVATQLTQVSGLETARSSLLDVAQALNAASTPTEIRHQLDQLCPVLADVPAQWEIVTRYGVATNFVPGMVATLAGDPVTSDLVITSQGSETTRYQITFDAPAGLNVPAPQTITLDPGETTTLPVEVSAPDTGFMLLTATVAAIDSNGDPLGVSSEAQLAINVVDAFVGILDVAAMPDFVETGTSQTDLLVNVANIANVPLPVTAHVSLRPAESSVISWTDTVPLTILTGDPQTYDLGTVDTSGYAAGLYVIDVELRDESGDLLPDGAGQGFLTVGQALAITHAVSPSLVAPGDVQVTTMITTAYHSETQQGGDPITSDTEVILMPWGATDDQDYFWHYHDEAWHALEPPQERWYWQRIVVNPYNHAEWLALGNTRGSVVYRYDIDEDGQIAASGTSVSPLWYTDDAGQSFQEVILPASSSGPRRTGSGYTWAGVNVVDWSETIPGRWFVVSYSDSRQPYNTTSFYRGLHGVVSDGPYTSRGYLSHRATTGVGDTPVILSQWPGSQKYLRYVPEGSNTLTFPAGGRPPVGEPSRGPGTSTVVAIPTGSGVYATADYHTAQPTTAAVTSYGGTFITALASETWLLGGRNGGLVRITDLLGTANAGVIPGTESMNFGFGRASLRNRATAAFRMNDTVDTYLVYNGIVNGEVLSGPVDATPGSLANWLEVIGGGPLYGIELTHTVTISNMTVLTDTFSHPPQDSLPDLRWQYWQEVLSEPIHRTSFDGNLPAMQPGEVRKVSEATSVTYQLRSGNNTLTLPPLYVTAGHIIALSAASAPASPGSSVVYEIDLFNPGNTADTYTLEVPGIPADWVTLPPVVAMAAGEHKTIELIITIPADADVSSYPFAVVATTGSGGSDQAMETLDLVPAAFELSITPDLIRAAPGELLPYTLTLSNPAAIDHTFALSVTGLPADLLVSLPASVEVSSSSSISVSLLITATTGGFVPFQVTATRQSNPPRAAVVPAAFSVEGKTDLALTLDPPAASAGPGTPARFTLTVNNTGNLSDTFDLTVQLPGDDWSYELLANDTPQSSLSLIPLVFNNASLHLHVTPPPGTPAGNYPITVVGTSRLVPGTHATIQGEVHVLPQGVTVEILPQHMTMQPDEQVTWDVRVTNTGSIADTFDLTPGGLIGPHSSLSRDSVALDANASTIVQLALDQLPSALPGDHALAMMAQSQSAPDIAGHDTALLKLGGRPDAAITISPAVQTLSQTVAISYLVTITNTGNIDMIYHLTPDIAVDGLLLTLETDAVFIPARMSASLLIRVEQEGVPPAGQHPFTITAIGSSATATGTAWIIIPETRDTLPPDTIIISGPASLSDSSAATFVFTGTDDLSLPADLTFACSIDGGVWEPCTSPYIYANLAEGEHTIAIRAIDLSGNVDPSPAIFTWIIDFDTPTTGDDDDDTPTPGDDDDDTPAPGDDDDDMPAPGDDDNDTPAPIDDDDDTPAPGDDDDDTPDQPAQSPRSIYLPLIAKAGSPDLVGQFTLDSDLNALQADHPVVVSVVVTNTGTAPTQAGFWVDLYINPTVPPDQTNLPWHELCQLDACIGVAWYVPYVLDVGERITLTTEHYAEEWSSWNGQLPGGTVDLYLYVDTWNANAETGEWQVGGAVPEGREDNNGFQLPGLLVGAPAEQTPAQLSGLDNPHNWSTRPALLPE